VDASQNVTLAGTLTATGVTTVPAGTVSAPAITTTGDTNTGIFFPAADTIAFSEGGTEAMRIDSSGNVGIGTISPTGKLQVKAANPQIWMEDSAAGTNGKFTAIGTSNGNMTFNRYLDNGTLAGEYMRLDSSGNLLVGATNNSGQRLQVAGSSTNDNSGIFSAVNTNTAAAACVAAFATGTNSTATSNVLIRFGIDNYNQGSGQINANGAGAVAFGAFSDSRLKENIVDLPSQLDNIMALRPVEYDYIESMGGGHQIGFVAQEVQAIYPDLVGEAEDGMLTLSDMNKNDARLIKAIQEMKAIIDTQASTITQLQADVAALKGASA
jgi:hypothetical protein